MDRTPELISARPCHVEPDDCIPFGIEKYPAHAPSIDGHPVLFDLSGKALKHGRTKVVPFGILVPDLNHRGESEAEDSLLGHEFEIFDRDLDDLLRLREYRPGGLPPESARDSQHQHPSPLLGLVTFHVHPPFQFPNYCFPLRGSGTVNTGQPAVRTTFSAVAPKKSLFILSDRPP